MYQVIEWFKSLFAREDEESKSQRELEDRIRIFKRLLAIRISNFEHRYGHPLSVRQKIYLAKKLDERIALMRKEYQKKWQK